MILDHSTHGVPCIHGDTTNEQQFDPFFIDRLALCYVGFNLDHQTEAHTVVAEPVASTVMASSALPGDPVIVQYGRDHSNLENPEPVIPSVVDDPPVTKCRASKAKICRCAVEAGRFRHPDGLPNRRRQWGGGAGDHLGGSEPVEPKPHAPMWCSCSDSTSQITRSHYVWNLNQRGISEGERAIDEEKLVRRLEPAPRRSLADLPKEWC